MHVLSADLAAAHPLSLSLSLTSPTDAKSRRCSLHFRGTPILVLLSPTTAPPPCISLSLLPRLTGVKSVMLNLTHDYKLLLRFGGNQLSATHPQQLPPVPLSPFAFTILGRLSSLQGVTDGHALIANIQAFSVKMALKKAQEAQARLQLQAHTPEELAAVARDAENPFWLPEIQRHVQQHGVDQPCRYILVEDLLHPTL